MSDNKRSNSTLAFVALVAATVVLILNGETDWAVAFFVITLFMRF